MDDKNRRIPTGLATAATQKSIVDAALVFKQRDISMPANVIRCPICERPFDTSQSPALPFCSDRCRQIDLGRWLREAYSIPIERPEESSSGDESADSD